VAVVGLQFEARIIAGPAVRAVVLGSEPIPLVAMLLPTDRGVISFGICGGLSPELASGACVIASSILDGTRAWATDKAWTRSLARSIPNAIVGPILGVDAPVLDVAAKTRLHKRHGAVAVDMESHVAALAANTHGLPLVAVRAVADDATCALLTVALAGRRADGSVNVAGVLAALREKPGDLAPLIRLAVRTGSARATLARLRPILSSDFRTLLGESGGGRRLRGEHRKPRPDRLEDEAMRLGGDILERRRVCEHRTRAPSDVALGRHLRKVHVAEDVGRALLGVAQLGVELRQAARSEHGCDGAGDPLGVEPFGDLSSGASDDLRSEPAAIFHDLDRRRLQLPDQPREGEEP
jgi:hypothetical protein